MEEFVVPVVMLNEFFNTVVPHNFINSDLLSFIYRINVTS